MDYQDENVSIQSCSPCQRAQSQTFNSISKSISTGIIAKEQPTTKPIPKSSVAPILMIIGIILGTSYLLRKK